MCEDILACTDVLTSIVTSCSVFAAGTTSFNATGHAGAGEFCELHTSARQCTALCYVHICVCTPTRRKRRWLLLLIDQHSRPQKYFLAEAYSGTDKQQRESKLGKLDSLLHVTLDRWNSTNPRTTADDITEVVGAAALVFNGAAREVGGRSARGRYPQRWRRCWQPRQAQGRPHIRTRAEWRKLVG